MDKFIIARDNMIKGQMLPNKITDASIIAAMADVPRHSFLPEKFKAISYSDENIQLNEKRVAISPFVFARMVQAAGVLKGDVVLDVACGSGYSSAIFSSLAKKVVAIESDPDLASRANLVLKALDVGNVIILNDKMSAGSPESGPYNVIFINGAVKHVPHRLLEQLADGGRLITVISDRPYGGVVAVFRREGDKIVRTDIFDAAIPLIRDLEEEGSFSPVTL